MGKPILLETQHADLRYLPTPPVTLRDKIRVGLGLYPCDILFVHIDADNNTRAEKVDTISKAIEELTISAR